MIRHLILLRSSAKVRAFSALRALLFYLSCLTLGSTVYLPLPAILDCISASSIALMYFAPAASNISSSDQPSRRRTLIGLPVASTTQTSKSQVLRRMSFPLQSQRDSMRMHTSWPRRTALQKEAHRSRRSRQYRIRYTALRLESVGRTGARF